MKVSVAMATFNGARYLAAQLESIANQTVLPDEIIITDDQSDDATLTIAESFARTAPCRVEVSQNGTRLSSRKNFITAISLCRNDIVAMCDQDDVWLPRKLERTSGQFNDPHVMATIHGVTLVDSQLRPLPAKDISRHWNLRGVYKPLTIKPWYSPYGMSMLIRKELFSWVAPDELYAFEPQIMGHDAWAWFLASVFGDIVAVHERLALYRQHETNLCGAPPPEGIHLAVKRANLTGSNHYRDLANRAAMRACKLERLSSGVPPIIKERASVGAAYYETLADYLRERAALYTTHGRVRRCKLFTDIAFSGGYRSDHRGGLGTKALLKDVCNGIVCNKLIA